MKFLLPQKDTLCNILSHTIARNKVTLKSNLSYSDKVALKELKSNDNIITTKTDTVGQIVLMDKKDYFDEVSTLLQEGPYVEIK